jgi:hypothetical protein
VDNVTHTKKTIALKGQRKNQYKVIFQWNFFMASSFFVNVFILSPAGTTSCITGGGAQRNRRITTSPTLKALQGRHIS